MLRFECVICGELISHPKCNVYTCGNLKCHERYDIYNKKIYKLKKIIEKDIDKFKRMGETIDGIPR